MMTEIENNQLSHRIKLLRKHFKMTQAEFGTKIGVSRDVINNFENKSVVPSEPVIRLIVHEFGVNRTWLETGEGEMLKDTSPEDEIVCFVRSVLSDESDSFKKRFMTMLASLDEDGWELLAKMAETLAGGSKDDCEKK